MSGIAEYMLVALYGRCRHSDLSHLEPGIKDFQGCMGVLEFRTKLHKTSRAARRKGLLSILVPAQGVQAGITPEDKAVLGRHARSVQGTEAIYNRDLSAQAVNKLASVLKAVCDKRFHPDALFRQFWASGNPEPVLHTPVFSPNPQVERKEPLRRQEQPIKEAEPESRRF